MKNTLKILSTKGSDYMVITRVFDDQEYHIELTEQEISDAYEEYRCKDDLLTVCDFINACDEDYCIDVYEAHKEDIQSAVIDIVEYTRFLIDEYGMGIDDAIDEAIKSLVGRAIPYCESEDKL